MIEFFFNDGEFAWLPSDSRGNHDAQVATIVVPYEGLVLFSFILNIIKRKKENLKILFKKKFETISIDLPHQNSVL